MELMFAQSIIAGIAALVGAVCWVVLWLKTGHGAGWAVLGAVPLVLNLAPGLLLGTGVVAVEEFAVVNILCIVLFAVYFAVFTFKRWPIQNWKSAAEAFE